MIYFQAEIDNKSRSTIGSKLELVQYVNYITRGKVKKEIIVMHKIYIFKKNGLKIRLVM